MTDRETVKSYQRTREIASEFGCSIETTQDAFKVTDNKGLNLGHFETVSEVFMFFHGVRWGLEFMDIFGRE